MTSVTPGISTNHLKHKILLYADDAVFIMGNPENIWQIFEIQSKQIKANHFRYKWGHNDHITASDSVEKDRST